MRTRSSEKSGRWNEAPQRDYRPATSVARRKSVLSQESNHVADGTVAVGVEFDPDAATKISLEPAPPLRFSVSRNGRVELTIDCGEGVSWAVSQIGGNVRLAIDDGSDVGSGTAKLRCSPDGLYALTVPRLAMLRIEFDNGDKISRTVDCAVSPKRRADIAPAPVFNPPPSGFPLSRE